MTLAPVSGLIHAGPQLAADRFSYLPSLSLCLLPGAGVAAALAQPALGRVVVAAAAVWIASLATLTWSQVQVWRDTDTLFVYTLEVAPDCAWCHHQYGGSLGNRGRLEPAIVHFERAVALLPDRIVYRYHLGLALLKAGRPAPGAAASASTPWRRRPGISMRRRSSGSRWWPSIARPKPCRTSSACGRRDRRGRKHGWG